MPGRLPLFSPGDPHAAPWQLVRALVAVPYRQAGLIAACVLAGAATSQVRSPREAHHAAAVAVARVSAASQASDGGLGFDLGTDVDLSLQLPPPGAGTRAIVAAPDRPGATTGETKGVALLGPIAGLLLGLLLAAQRELGGDRMRSPREAEWALGLPVLGAIPTLSARARNLYVAPAQPA